jgi:hypothetical protein
VAQESDTRYAHAVADRYHTAKTTSRTDDDQANVGHSGLFDPARPAKPAVDYTYRCRRPTEGVSWTMQLAAHCSPRLRAVTIGAGEVHRSA